MPKDVLSLKPMHYLVAEVTEEKGKKKKKGSKLWNLRLIITLNRKQGYLSEQHS